MIEPSNAEKAEWSDVTRDYVHALEAEIERLKREVMLQMGWKTEAQNEIERLCEREAELHDQLQRMIDRWEAKSSENERLKTRLHLITHGTSEEWVRDQVGAALLGGGDASD